MNAEASREIMWNVSATGNTVMMYTLFALSMVIAAIGVFRHGELVLAGKADPEHLGNLWRRFVSLFRQGLLQKKVVRKRKAGLSHTLIYLGFLVLLFTTTMVFIDHDFGIRIYQGNFYLGVTLLSDIFGFGIIVGCLLAAHRRYISKPDLLHNRPADSFMLWMLVLLCVQGFMLEGLRIHATQDPWAIYSPIGLGVAKFFWHLSEPAARTLHFATWWFHTVTVFVFFALIPYTKFFHFIASAANLYFQPRKRPLGEVRSPGDLEKLIEQGEEFSLGLGTIKDYSWKQLTDLEACTSCGRCQEVCPAYITGKPLSPKWMILDTRNHALALHAEDKLAKSYIPLPFRKLDGWLNSRYLAKSSGLTRGDNGEGYSADGEFRALNPLVQKASRNIGRSVEDRIAGDVMDPDVFWSCNTCMACVEACPVGINHVDIIVENRQNMALMHGEIPSEASNTLRALETRGNPFGAPEDRTNWLAGLDVKILQPGDSVDYLYWVGCVSSYDPRKQKIAQSLVKLMNHAGLSFGILGTSEGCTGDPARRLGEENLFQTLAKTNIETLKGITFKTLVANCPHCFNTIKNEYPEFGNLGEGRSPEIIHHSKLLRDLVKAGKIKLNSTEQEVTFHDPCYLGRYNEEYDAPRDTLKANSKLKIVEMEQSRNKGLCCGAGGGHFWMDMKVGERVNVVRINQAAETGAKQVATACPFCMQMLEDGAKLTDREESMQIKDIAEFMADNLVVD